MAAVQRVILFVVLSLTALAQAKPADEVTINDVHLNSVLPESELVRPLSRVDDQLQVAAVQNVRLELQPEELTTKAPTTTPPPPTTIPPHRQPHNPSYFSRVITSIFEIPIAVLTAVRNLLQTTATTKITLPPLPNTS